MKIFKRAIQTSFYALCAVAFLLVAAGTVYLNRVGLSAKWRDRVSSEFRRLGLEIEIGRLTVHPLRGLIAKDVSILDPDDANERLVTVNHLGLHINLAGALRHIDFIDAVDLRHARISIPLDRDEKDGPRLRGEDVSALIYFSPGRVQVNRAEGLFHGIHISASGALLNPHLSRRSDREKETHKQRNDRITLTRRIFSELDGLHFSGAPPKLDVEFSGDLSMLETLRIDRLHLRTGAVARDQWIISRTELLLTYASGRILVQRLRIGDPTGSLVADGHFDTATGAGSARVRSTLALRAFLDELLRKHKLADLRFYVPPTIEAEVSLDPKCATPLRVIGHTALGRFGFRSVIFEGLGAGFSWDGNRLFVKDLELRHKSGTAKADLFMAPGDFRMNLESHIDPLIALPFAEGKAAQFLSEWQFGKPPHVRLRARGTAPDIAKLSAEGDLTLTNTTFRGTSLHRMTSKVEIRDGAATYRDFRIERAEGVATGTFVYDFGKGEARMEGIRSTLNPIDIIVWVDPKMQKVIEPYRCRSTPTLAIDGTVKLGKKPNNKFRILVDCPKGMHYEFIGKDLPFDRVTGTLDFVGSRLKLKEVRGTLYGGIVNADADISIIQEDPAHSAYIRLSDVDFPSITNLYFDYKDSKGQLAGFYRFNILAGDARKMTGQGRVEVTDGNVFAIPVLGPLSGILNAIVPGMGIANARRAVADFTIRDGVINTKNFDVLGQGFSMIGGGDLYFLDDKMDFSVRINAQGLPGVLLFPVSKFFEYVSSDSLSRPNWRPKIIPRLTR